MSPVTPREQGDELRLRQKQAGVKHKTSSTIQACTSALELQDSMWEERDKKRWKEVIGGSVKDKESVFMDHLPFVYREEKLLH